MTTDKVIRLPKLEVQVEQAIAFGRSRRWIRTNLGVDEACIDAALARINDASAVRDHVAAGQQ